VEQAGVALLAVDEGIHRDLIPGLAVGGASRPKKATPVLTRRVKQAISEWYVLNMLELSWEGFIQHTIQGWNVGKPPYGYLAEKIPHRSRRGAPRAVPSTAWCRIRSAGRWSPGSTSCARWTGCPTTASPTG